MALQRDRSHCVECSQLLLQVGKYLTKVVSGDFLGQKIKILSQVWECGSNPRAGRAFTSKRQNKFPADCDES